MTTHARSCRPRSGGSGAADPSAATGAAAAPAATARRDRLGHLVPVLPRRLERLGEDLDRLRAGDAVLAVEDEEGHRLDAEHLGRRLVAADVVAVVVGLEHVAHDTLVEADVPGEPDEHVAVADREPV